MMIGFVFPICCELTRKVRVSWRFYTNVHQSICIYDVHQSVPIPLSSRGTRNEVFRPMSE